MRIKKDSRVIANYSANCQTIEDEYSVLDFCFAEDTNLLLHLEVKRKTTSGSILRHFALTTQEAVIFRSPAEVFP